HVDAGAAEREHGQDVGLEGVADHEEAARGDRVFLQDAGVGGVVFFGDDFDVAETVGEAGFGEFALLVAQVALGDEDERVVVGGEFGEGVGDAVEQFDGVGEHVAPLPDEFADLVGADAAVGQVDGGLDGGEGEAFHAVAVEFEVAHFGGEEDALDLVGVVAVGEQFAEAAVHAVEDDLVVPECVVGVEADGEGAAHAAESMRGRWRGQARANAPRDVAPGGEPPSLRPCPASCACSQTLYSWPNRKRSPTTTPPTPGPSPTSSAATSSRANTAASSSLSPCSKNAA